MAQSYLIFDFGTNEEAAQQARHRIEGWKQAFRLGSKVLVKFKRSESKQPEDAPEAKSEKKKSDGGEEKSEGAEHIRVLVRLDFSNHERLSHQRWLDRIPSEEPFKSASSQVIRTGETEFDKTSELFDSLT
jgi:hypothetical protein